MIRSAADVYATAYLGGICFCVSSFISSVDRQGEVSPGVLGPAGVGVVKLKSYASPNTSRLRLERIRGQSR